MNTYIPDWMTIKQIDSAIKLFERNPDGSNDFMEWFARFENYGDYAGIKWCGMFIGIESDGYTHS